jgi:hypothetical protein
MENKLAEIDLSQITIYEIADLTQRFFEENEKQLIEYVSIDDIQSKKDEILFYLQSLELAKWK